jgi:hypothetical protein
MLIGECLCDEDHKIVWGRFENALQLSSTLARANELDGWEAGVQLTQRNKKTPSYVASHSGGEGLSRNLRLSKYVMRTWPQQTLEAAAIRQCNKSKNTSENDHGNTRQTSTDGIR